MKEGEKTSVCGVKLVCVRCNSCKDLMWIQENKNFCVCRDCDDHDDDAMDRMLQASEARVVRTHIIEDF